MAELVDALVLILARERVRRRASLHAVGGGVRALTVADGGNRAGRKAVNDALQPRLLEPWQDEEDPDDDAA